MLRFGRFGKCGRKALSLLPLPLHFIAFFLSSRRSSTKPSSARPHAPPDRCHWLHDHKGCGENSGQVSGSGPSGPAFDSLRDQRLRCVCPRGGPSWADAFLAKQNWGAALAIRTQCSLCDGPYQGLLSPYRAVIVPSVLL
ncbi:hypothetical protein GQ53DRAFT_115287 [Thozetella sp. PMI_491]|nr:hypothetical protein GQ53DRAFT_115287 [Thozetella sp. PMI_491]